LMKKERIMDAHSDVCKNCGTPLDPDDLFCGKCGHAVSNELSTDGPAPAETEDQPSRDPEGKREDTQKSKAARHITGNESAKEPAQTSAPPLMHDEELSPSSQKRIKRISLQRLIITIIALSLVVFVSVAVIYAGGIIDEALYDKRTISLSFNSGGDLLASGCYDGRILIWNMKTQKTTQTLNGQFGAITALTIDNDRGFVTSWDSENKIGVWDAKKGKLIRVLEGPEAHCNASPAFSRRGRKVAFCSKGSVRICDPLTGQVKGVLRTDDLLRSLAFSWDNRILAVGSWGKVLLWDWRIDRLERSLKLGGSPQAIAFSSNGLTMAVRPHNEDIELRDIESGSVRRQIKWKGHFIESLAFSPDGEILAATGGSGGGDWCIRLFKVRTGEVVKTLWLSPLWKRLWARAGID
jgi:WD40 repeat protein